MPVIAQTQEQVLQQMKPGTGIEEEPKFWWSDWPRWTMGAGVVLLGVGLGAALALRVTRRNRTLTTVAAHQAALQELKKIEAMELPAKGELERYHTELSNLLRKYLEQRFRLAATRQTTPEFLENARTAVYLNPVHQRVLREFLEQCDLVKFAQVRPTPEEAKAIGATARKLIVQTAPASA